MIWGIIILVSGCFAFWRSLTLSNPIIKPLSSRVSYFLQVKEAIKVDGVAVKGYTSWRCIDVVSVSTAEMKKVWLHLCGLKW